MEDRIATIVNSHIEIIETLHTIIEDITSAAKIMTQCINSGNKILFAGNGGSAADAQHLAAELVNRFLQERKPLPGLALTTDTSILTAVSNDYSYNDIFVKQLMALGKDGDVFIGISTSGNSANVINAINTARQMNIYTIGLTGEGGSMRQIVDCSIAVPSKETPRIQEAHILIGHILCEMIEEAVC